MVIEQVAILIFTGIGACAIGFAIGFLKMREVLEDMKFGLELAQSRDRINKSRIERLTKDLDFYEKQALELLKPTTKEVTESVKKGEMTEEDAVTRSKERRKKKTDGGGSFGD